jgi:Ca2+-binding RTX toxin-like protein
MPALTIPQLGEPHARRPYRNLTLIGGAAISGTGNALRNLIIGNNAANTLRGLDGFDDLMGQGGNDRLEGGNGRDALDGGVGADRMIAAQATTPTGSAVPATRSSNSRAAARTPCSARSITFSARTSRIWRSQARR